MKVDLRDKIKNESMMKELPINHRKIFEEKLHKDLHTKRMFSYKFLKIAASVLILLSLGISSYQFYRSGKTPQEIVQSDEESGVKFNSMGEISPNLKKVEDYYLTHINYQIAKIKITDENRAFLDAYFVELGKLQEEYSNSIAEINSDEISEETINALINNLQMRLKLMYQLKAQLKKIDNLNKQENEINKA